MNHPNATENPYSPPKAKLESISGCQIQPEKKKKYLIWAIIHGTLIVLYLTPVLFSPRIVLVFGWLLLYSGIRLPTYILSYLIARKKFNRNHEI